MDFPKKACEPRENTDFQKVLEERAELWLEPVTLPGPFR